MNQSIQELSELARKREITKREVAERMEARLIAAFNGGMWKISPAFISFIDVMTRYGKQVVIIDEYGVPRQVNPNELLDFAVKRYQEVLNQWYNEYVETNTKKDG